VTAAGRDGIPFVKMHGLGNDYVFVDLLGPRRGGPEPAGELPWDPAALSREISDRHLGVGSDGLILILPGERAPFRMRMFNADGSEGEMCGNGMRCFAKYVYEQGYTDEVEFEVETGAGVVRPRVYPEEGAGGRRVQRVRVDLGRPRLTPDEVPVRVEALARWGRPADAPVVEATLEVDGREVPVTAVSLGNPHCVVFVEDAAAVDLEGLGRRLEVHPAFPQRTNVEFVQVLSPAEVAVRVWERGSGATLACGTGACAAAVAGALTGRTGRQVTVRLPGGALEVEWAADGHVYLTGPAVEVFRGVYAPR